jgi:acyl-coenzyme A synthetase/AMP-(fatty) acid ligase
MLLDWLFERFRCHADAAAIVWRDETYSYGQLLDRMGDAARFLEGQRIDAGASIMLNGDYSPDAIAFLLAAAAKGIVIVPLA